jgi:two-component system LytT family response regulator
MTNCIIIDDEIHCIETLVLLLNEHCPEVQIVEKTQSPQAGLQAITRLKPDLVFLDIEMPNMNGFELLEHFDQIPFSVVFTTSYDQYAIKAIRFCALDYLMKPVDYRELITAVNKVKKQTSTPSNEQFQMLLQKIQDKGNGFTKIAVPTSDGFELVPADQIVSCEADDNYTYLHLKNKTKITACRSLKEIEEQLETYSNFLRVHHSYIVNLNEVTKYVRGDGGYLVMSTGSSVNVSRSRKDTLMNYF